VKSAAHRWLVWLLAAWLPVAGIASASATPLLVSRSLPASIDSGAVTSGEHAGCHQHQMSDSAARPAADDAREAMPCCKSGTCFCNCGAVGSALPATLTLMFSPPPTIVMGSPVEPVHPAPPANPFRPPIA
jgi:hypothetical protein